MITTDNNKRRYSERLTTTTWTPSAIKDVLSTLFVCFPADFATFTMQWILASVISMNCEGGLHISDLSSLQVFNGDPRFWLPSPGLPRFYIIFSRFDIDEEEVNFTKQLGSANDPILPSMKSL